LEIKKKQKSDHKEFKNKNKSYQMENYFLVQNFSRIFTRSEERRQRKKERRKRRKRRERREEGRKERKKRQKKRKKNKEIRRA
jgi:hypothetical protein